MNMKKKLLIKLGILGILVSMSIINILAATPGTSCTIRARVLGVINTTLPGRVGSSGVFCQPTGSLPDILTPLGTGVRCGGVEYVIGVIRASATCPR
jgi:hypothetical protein